MLFLDTSALLKRYVDEDGTALVLGLMEQDRAWAASALAHTEAAITLCHGDLPEGASTRQRQRLRSDWERFLVVPLDASCLIRAAEIGCERSLRTLDAIHVAAAVRLPGSVAFLTFDARQASAARGLGIEVLGARG
jgi:predicted nucleic acid-binding protein